MNRTDWPHRPVMPREVMHYLAPKPGEVVLDATAGSGGHTELVAAAVGRQGLAIGCDRDESILEVARDRLKPLDQVRLFKAAFDQMAEVLDAAGVQELDGVLFDLGVSSLQLDEPERGFSFRNDAPLDMRMDARGDDPTAADLLATMSEADLADAFFRYADERKSRRIAREIVRRRQAEPIRRTGQLADLVAGCVRGRPGGIHPATRVFQALRMAVNDELGQLQRGLEQAASVLAPGGRLVVISFHSVEDRVVKNFLRDRDDLDVLTRKPVTPAEDELAENVRSRSAKLRAARRVGQAPNEERGR